METSQSKNDNTLGSKRRSKIKEVFKRYIGRLFKRKKAHQSSMYNRKGKRRAWQSDFDIRREIDKSNDIRLRRCGGVETCQTEDVFGLNGLIRIYLNRWEEHGMLHSYIHSSIIRREHVCLSVLRPVVMGFSLWTLKDISISQQTPRKANLYILYSPASDWNSKITWLAFIPNGHAGWILASILLMVTMSMVPNSKMIRKHSF